MKPNFWIDIFLDAQQEIRGKLGEKNYRDAFIQTKRMSIARDFDALAKRKPAQARKIRQTLGI